MNKRYLYGLGLAIGMGLAFTACSDEKEDLMQSEGTTVMDDQGNFVYTMDFNGGTPSFEDDATRATSYTWDNGATLYLRFKNGSSYVTGTATYNKSAGSWSVTTASSLPTTSAGADCEVYYFVGEGTVGTSTIDMTEHTACYLTTSGIYKHPSTNAISVTATLKPMTWRLRFSGTSGTTITMDSYENDIYYYNSFNKSTAEFSKARKDISLTVSGGYTPYIYGDLIYNSVDNDIVVRNGSYRYERDLYKSDLPVGKSGYYTIPTANSYDGWTRTGGSETVSCKFVPKNLLAFTDGVSMAWEADNNVSQGYYKVFKKSAISSMSDESIISEIKEDNTADTAAQLNDMISSLSSSSFFLPSTDYVVCTIAYDSNGNEGELQKTEFTTRSSSLRQAELSDLRYGTYSGTNYWYFVTTAKNSASSYYLYANENQTVYGWSEQYLAYRVYFGIQNGEMGMSSSSIYSLWGDLNLTRTGNCLSLCSWAIISGKNLGNPSVLQGAISSSSPKLTKKVDADRSADKLQHSEIHYKNMVEDILNTGQLTLVLP